jgi:hypothetical protein
MSDRPRRGLRHPLGLLALVVVMLALHNDFWWWKSRALVLGVLPVGLAWHIGYSVLASVAMWLLVRFAWPSDLDEEPGREPGEGRKAP